MSLPSQLLASTEGRALGTVVYGGAGLRKSLAKATLPYPILDNDFEGGNVAILPWTRRRRKWNEKSWTEVSQDDRERALDMIEPAKRAFPIKAAGLVDSIWYDNLNPASYTEYIAVIGNFEPSKYNSLVGADSLAELSFDIQTFSKGSENSLEPMKNALLWAPIQERTAIALRRVRNYRDAGVFTYFTGQELIDKDYITDPRSTQAGAKPPEPYSVKGTVDIPGKLVNVVQHTTDLMFHTRMLNGEPVWVTQSEAISGGVANWETKDRTGRIKDKYVRPNFRTLLLDIYGEEGRDAIYTSSKELLAKG